MDLASFFNWCASQAIAPEDVDDAALQRFHSWLENRTLCPKPRDVVRRVPNLWNEASEKIRYVGRKIKLTTLSFKAPFKRRQWVNSSESFRRDVQALSRRCAPSPIFSTSGQMRRGGPLAESTLRQQREHLRLAASVLIESGVAVEDIKSLADLVEPERFKAVLRHYHEHANRAAERLRHLPGQDPHPGRAIPCGRNRGGDRSGSSGSPPSCLASLTNSRPKNKALLRQFESDRLAGKAPFPSRAARGGGDTRIWRRAGSTSSRPRWRSPSIFNSAIPLQAAESQPSELAAAFQSSPTARRGALLLHIPKAEMKSRRRRLHRRSPRRCGSTAALVPASHPAAPQRRYERRSIRHQEGAQEGPEDPHHSNHQSH